MSTSTNKRVRSNSESVDGASPSHISTALPKDASPQSLTSERQMRTAWELASAMRTVQRGQSIGSIVTSWEFNNYKPKKLDKIHKQVLVRLSAARNATLRTRRTHAWGHLQRGCRESFSLKVTYPGCEFETEDLHGSDLGSNYSAEKVLRGWLEHAPVSGFGDNRLDVMQTRVDDTIRKASKIPRESFDVDPKIIIAVSDLWSKTLLPSRVRVEPYKIHVYGEGGHFQSHRDTPEAGLVGTFLLGVGDTTYSKGYYYDEEGIRRGAHVGDWVAFYSDVPHAVSTLERGQRAVIAFKIFTLEDSENDTVIQFPTLVTDTRTVLDSIPIPFGLILDHQYPMGTTASDLTGSDSVLFAACRQLQSSPINPETSVTHVEIIPVLVKAILER
ncbi:hypothetical protein BDV98DRAFT_608631 [Pterulicium gracile]|uniref:Fe2OG dioxygenase domain-containing protein n=1 Tax=Pterulicium gracile TaxID=1884261 RepID=A0A5C3Q256_9AGAR|nr:hypothetical protein BDV98DRAFT_608631 [Pterula gracilis]